MSIKYVGVDQAVHTEQVSLSRAATFIAALVNNNVEVLEVA